MLLEPLLFSVDFVLFCCSLHVVLLPVPAAPVVPAVPAVPAVPPVPAVPAVHSCACCTPVRAVPPLSAVSAVPVYFGDFWRFLVVFADF